MSKTRKINDISIQEIIEEIGLILKTNDIIYLCENEKVINEYVKISEEGKNREEKTKNFILEHENAINKEKLILLSILNIQDNIRILNEKMDSLKKNERGIEVSELFTQISQTKFQIHACELMLEKAIKLGKGTNTFLTYYYYDELQKRYRIEVISSQEVIEKRENKNLNKNRKRFNEVDLYFKGGDEKSKDGLEYVLQSILLTDLYQTFPDEQFGNDIRTMILENQLLKSGIKTEEEISKLKTVDNIDKYVELIDNIKFPDILQEIKNTLKEYSDYLDVDKLLMISAYRFYDGLESKKLDLKNSQSIKILLESILNNVSNQVKEISCELQMVYDNETYENHMVNFSKKDLNDCINRFTSSTYLTKNEVQEYRIKVENDEITLLQISPEIIDKIFNKQELEKIAMKNEENLVYVVINENWNFQKILEAIEKVGKFSSNSVNKLLENDVIDEENIITLYQLGYFSLEELLNLKEKINYADLINSSELIKYYKTSIQKDCQDEDKERFEKYYDLYKSIFLEEKDDKEKISNKVMQEIIEQLDGKSYEDAIMNYYQRGLITLNTIAEWCDTDFIEKMYDNKFIIMEDLVDLGKDGKISYELLSSKYKQLIENDITKTEEILKHIRSGFITEEDIFDLYSKNIIFDADMNKLAEEGFIRLERLENERKMRKIEELEQNSKIQLKGLSNLTKINNDIYSDKLTDGEMIYNKKKPKLIIDPNERRKFMKLLGACEVEETDVEEDSPFYNYEFYAIPDEKGEIGLESVIIAERYYEDKKTETKFATNNATYFFKYKDLMVLSNLEKSEMTKERKNIVFTAKHIVTNGDKQGRWAAEVIYAVAKTMLASGLDEYSKDNQRKIIIEKLGRFYGDEKLSSIIDKAIQIDSEESVYEIEDSSVGRKKKSSYLEDEER